MSLLATIGAAIAFAVPAAQHHRLFHYWHKQPIADCAWVGESSPPGDYSGEFSQRRYHIYNSQGSGARGKYQMIPSTYHYYAKLHDWSRADQEYAGHKLYRAKGISPWKACG